MNFEPVHLIMPSVIIRCYAELNDLLPPDRQYRPFTFPLLKDTRIVDILLALGVLSEQLDLILVNNISVGLDYLCQENDRIALYPVFETFDISSASQLRDVPLRRPKFVLDVHLGKLARFLRLFGFDALYEKTYSDDRLAAISLEENRTLLSKDQDLIEGRGLSHVYRIRNDNPQEQLDEVMSRFDLSRLAVPFSRCLLCNTLVTPVELNTVADRMPDHVKEWCREYRRCETCGRIYWKGSHYAHMMTIVQTTLERHRHPLV